MSKRKGVDLPVLFFNGGEEHRRAYRALRQARLDCEFRGAAPGREPVLLVGHAKFCGLRQIEEFIGRLNTGER